MIVGGKGRTLKEEFGARKNYKESIATLIEDGSIDTWYQYPYYGFVNEKYEPVTANAGENYENLINFGDYADTTQRALPFVVKAYNDFREAFLGRSQTFASLAPKYLGELIPQKSYESYEDKYKEYIGMVSSKLAALRQSTKQEALQNVVNNAKIFPITQSGFSLSSHCPISTTGLAIDLALLPNDTDEFKIKLIEDPAYSCIVQDARSAGFFIDKNNPWRLIANLNSPNIRRYIQQYKPSTSIENILDRFFRRKVFYEDMQSVYKLFGGFSLTTQELIEYTIRVRMAELEMPESHFGPLNKQAQDVIAIYGNNYSQDPLKASNAIIGEHCSRHIKELYEKKARINSFQSTRLRDLT